MIMKRILLALIFAASYTYADDVVIGPMEGSGGPMKDAERRVLAPVKTARDKKAPLYLSENAVAGRPQLAPKKISGIVENVKIYGSREFGSRERISDRVLEALGGPGEKTSEQMAEAIFKVKRDLLEKGYYLVRISFLKEKAYDRDTKTLNIQVDEGRFGKINLQFENKEEEGTWFSRSQLLRRFRDIEEGATFDYKRLRDALFGANSHPDITIDTTVQVRKPIEGDGDDRRIARYADLNLDVRESFPLHMLWEVNNYGMEEVEEWQTSLTVQYMNLTKHDDVLTISPAMSIGGELVSVAGSYMLPHTWALGGNTTVYGGYSSLDIDDVVPRLDLQGLGWFLGLQHSEYLYDSDRHLFAVSAGLLWRYMEDRYTALGYKLNERSASIMPVSLALSYTGKRPDFLGGRNFATLQGVFNFVNTGDKIDAMWAGAEDKYAMLRWQLARLQPIFGWHDSNSDLNLHQWMLFLKFEGQYTKDSLIPLEKLSLGGYNCLRGYKTRGYLGDYGFYGTAELRTPILVDGIASMFGDRSDKLPFDRLQFLGFVDYGWLAYNDLATSDDTVFIWSAGVGTRFSITKHTQFRCDVAFPLRDTSWAKDDSAEIYFSVQVQF